MATKATTVRELLAELERLKIVRPGVREHLRAEQLLSSRAEWDRSTLAASMASLLAQNPRQWQQIDELILKRLGDMDGGSTERSGNKTGRLLSHPQPPAPLGRDRFLPRIRKALRRLTEVPLGVWAALVLIVVLVPIEWIFWPTPGPIDNQEHSEVIGAQDGGQPPPPAPDSGITYEQIEPARSIPVAPLPNNEWPAPVWLLVFLFFLSAMLIQSGSSWFWGLVTREWVKQRDHQKLLELRGALAEKVVEPQVPYHVERFPPFAEDAMDDAATILSRRARQELSEELDVGHTVDRAVRSAGRFDPLYVPGGASVPLVVLVDCEKGDHPYLDGVEWVLRRWERTGLHFSRYDFNYRPDSVWPRLKIAADDSSHRTCHDSSEATIELESLARRTEGSALLIFSRLAQVEDYRESTSWLERLAPWPVKVLVDVDPRTAEERKGFDGVASRLTRAGLPRFPFTPAGLEAAARTIAAGGEEAVPRPEELLRPLADVEEAIRAWATCAAYVPDPTWPQLEALRRTLPEVCREIPDQQYVQSLIEWAWQFSDVEPIGDGRKLAIPPNIVEELISERREVDRGKPPEQRLEYQARRLLLTQLRGVVWANSVYEENFRLLKIAIHESLLDPERALEYLEPLIGTTVEPELLQFLDQEARIKGRVEVESEGLPKETQDKLRPWLEPNSRLPRSWLIPLRPLRRWWAVSAVAMALLLILGSWGPWSWRGLREPTVRVTARLPAIWKLNLLHEDEPDQSSNNLENPPTGNSLGIVHTALAKVAPMRFVSLSGGEFWMGSLRDDPKSGNDERPRHRVWLSAFQISVYEVTQNQWEAVMGSNPSDCDVGCGNDLPIQAVSWLDAVQFLNKLSQREGLEPCYEISGETVRWPSQQCDGFRLPTEAEWEYAARAGSSEEYSSGNNTTILHDYAWYMLNSENHVQQVGKKLPNAFGLYDVHGNVWEWVWDWWGNYSNRIETDPRGPEKGTRRILRGGSYGSTLKFLRSAARYRYATSSDNQIKSFGFRCARSPRPQP